VAVRHRTVERGEFVSVCTVSDVTQKLKSVCADSSRGNGQMTTCLLVAALMSAFADRRHCTTASDPWQAARCNGVWRLIERGRKEVRWVMRCRK
jgi:hypothetical protein